MIAELRERLARGTAPERVRAAWELALALGGQAVAPLRAHVAREPSPGARRHVIIVLAGLGERDAVRALAEHDADVHVRATACRYVTTTASAASDEAAWLARRVVEDPSAPVLVVVVELAPETDVVLTAAIEALDAHPVREVREALVDRYERLGAPLSVVRRALVEPDAELRRRLAWLALQHDAQVVARLDDATAQAVIGNALRAARHVPHAALVAFVSRPRVHYEDRRFAREALERDPESSLELLLRLARSDPEMQERLLDRCEGAALGAEAKRELVSWLETGRRERDALAAALLDPDPDDSYPGDDRQLEQMRRLVARIEAILHVELGER